ncbi:hypothetical protein ONE63_001226 [Megalurothrips usitatus]|uniref:Proline-, glutamic acid- and leucine-rich protein 1-like n=1 Tax=Megalurothrips usitatus TaxID=439358 RepID=A0AAV7XF90_9NEOP|nr:hypothetical protein ONE63_001226 [Megalurothrips usitatus]
MGGMPEGAAHLSLDPIERVDPILRIQKLTNRILALSACLQAMLVMAYPVPKEVPLSCLLGLICRGVAINGSSLGDSLTTTRLALASNLPKIHYSLLKLLEALILLARTNMLPFARLMCKLVTQTLKWTQVPDWPYGTEKPYRCLRIQAYEVFKLWCGIAKSGSNVADSAQQFVQMALSDVYTEKDIVSLSVAIRTKQGNQKSKRKGNQAGLNPSTPVDSLLVNDAANKDVCVAALQALRAFVMSASTKIQATLHKDLQEAVVSVLLQTINKTEDFPIPYSVVAPRLELYRLLLQLVLDGHSVWPAPTNIALRIFSSGLHDQDAQISMFCGMAQSCIEKIIHPAYASLALLADIQELENCRGEENNRPIPAYKKGASERFSRSEEDNEAEVASLVDQAPAVPSIVKNSSIDSFNAVSTPVAPPRNTVLKTSPVSNQDAEVSGSNGRNMIDLTTSDKSDDDDDDISEIPCEVDLAGESDDENRSNVSLCSRTTASPPVVSQTENPKAVIAVEISEEATPALEGENSEWQSEAQEQKDISSTEAENVGTELEASGANAVSESAESSKRACEEEEEESSAKRQKADDSVADFDYNDDEDEESMLASFVNLTRDEEENAEGED